MSAQVGTQFQVQRLCVLGAQFGNTPYLSISLYVHQSVYLYLSYLYLFLLFNFYIIYISIYRPSFLSTFFSILNKKAKFIDKIQLSIHRWVHFKK